LAYCRSSFLGDATAAEIARSSALILPLRLLRLLGRKMRFLGEPLPFGRELQPGLLVLVAQRPLGLLAAFLRLAAVMIGTTLRHVATVVRDW
jgi:hypothetical protein